MKIKLSRSSESLYLIELEGNLDLKSSDMLKDYVIKMIKTKMENFIICLKDVVSINSAGIGALIYVFSTLRKLNCNLILLAPDGPVLEALEVSRLKSYFTIVHTLKDALQITGSK